MKVSVFLSLIIALLPHTVFASTSLQEKLAQQWVNYQNARALLLKQVGLTNLPIEQRMISRADWEATIALQGDFALTPGDIQTLRASQRIRIVAAREKARWESSIDLAEVRAQNEVAAFCSKLPKGGMLHVHPGGTLDRDTVNELLTTKNPVLPFLQITHDVETTPGMTLFPDELAWLKGLGHDENFLSLSPADQARYQSFLFLPPGKQSFERFESVFDFVGSAEIDYADEELALTDFARKAVREGVLYVEFTGGFNSQGLAIIQKIETEQGLKIRVNRSFNRTRSPVELDQTLQTLLSGAPNSQVVGIDFLDNESTNPAFEKGQMLYGTELQASLAGITTLHRTMHAGEIGDLRNPRDAMILGAERLGHGVNLAADPVALEYAAKIHEPVEINLTSNLRLTSVNSIAAHPFLDYLRLGLPVSLSTDDEGIFDTDIDQECVLAVGQTDVTYAEMKRMAFNSIKTSFASDDDKKLLLAELTRRFLAFEITETSEKLGRR
jgi:adenosine deaminase CECR1